jgi:hypothetical protein
MTRDALWSGPIVDAHQHFWDPIANDHPWLRPDVVIPFRYGGYSAIKRRYLPADYLAETVGRSMSKRNGIPRHRPMKRGTPPSSRDAMGCRPP